MFSDVIRDFVRAWEQGARIVVGVKRASAEPRLMFRLRQAYYRLLGRLSHVALVEQFTGFGLYDRSVSEILRSLREPYPYFRGLIAELGRTRDGGPRQQTNRNGRRPTQTDADQSKASQSIGPGPAAVRRPPCSSRSRIGQVVFCLQLASCGVSSRQAASRGSDQSQQQSATETGETSAAGHPDFDPGLPVPAAEG